MSRSVFIQLEPTGLEYIRMSSIAPASDARIVADRLAFAPADGRALFHDLTLSFGRERTGLIGPNGSGKTTLLRLLAGELEPGAGTVRRTGTAALLPQEFRPSAGVTLAATLGIDEVLAAIRRLEGGAARPDDIELVGDDWGLPERAVATLARFRLGHLSLDRPVGAVSGGEATRVALAGLTLRRPDFLLLDEPTNHLDRAGRDALYSFLDDWPGGFVCATHDRALLRRVDRIIEISSLGVRTYGGNYDAYRKRREDDDLAASRELDSARAELRGAEWRARELRERQARREARGRRDRSTANMPKILLNARKAQAQATGASVRAITEREVEERRARAATARSRVEERTTPRFQLPPTGLHATRALLELARVSVRFPGSPSLALAPTSLSVTGPERVAVVGANGSGKTTLLRIAAGRLLPTAGAVRRPTDEETAYLDQTGAALDPSASVLDSFRTAHPTLDSTEARHALARYLFSDEAALQPAGTLSGGERLRASLACTLGGRQPPVLLILDEPTNHLDLDAVAALEEALRSYDGALLVVSHDDAFLEAIGIERRIELRRGSSGK